MAGLADPAPLLLRTFVGQLLSSDFSVDYLSIAKDCKEQRSRSALQSLRPRLASRAIRRRTEAVALTAAISSSPQGAQNNIRAFESGFRSRNFSSIFIPLALEVGALHSHPVFNQKSPKIYRSDCFQGPQPLLKVPFDIDRGSALALKCQLFGRCSTHDWRAVAAHWYASCLPCLTSLLATPSHTLCLLDPR